MINKKFGPAFLNRIICLALFLTVPREEAVAKLALKVASTQVTFEYYSASNGNSALNCNIIYNGSVHIFPYNGSPPYTYVLTNPYQAQNASGSFDSLAAGVYTFEVTDANGNTVDTAVTINSVYPQPSVQISNILFPSACNKRDGGFTLSGSGGTPPYLYSIDGGATFGANNTFSNLTQGYYPFLLLKDANGFLAQTGFSSNPDSSNYFPVAVCPFYISASLAGAVSCSDSTGIVTINSTGGAPPIQFSDDSINYYQGMLNAGNGASQYSYTFTNLWPGLHYIYGKDAQGNVTVVSVPVIKQCNINISCLPVRADCHQKDGSLTVKASKGTPPYMYSLDGITFQQSNIFPGLGWGYYNVWVEDANGTIRCVNAGVGDNCPNISVLNYDATCGQNNGFIVATCSGGVPPLLYSLDSLAFLTSFTFTGLGLGTYTITVKDSDGFESSTSVSINASTCLGISATATSEGCYNKNGTITATVSGGTSPFQYSLDGVNFQGSNIFTGLDSGTYTVTVRDVNGFTNTTSVSLINVSGPAITALAVTADSCNGAGGGITVTASGGTPPFQYSNGGSNYQDTNVFINDTAGFYIVTVKDALNCVATDTAQVIKHAIDAQFFGNDTAMCAGQSIVLNAPAWPQSIYQWQDGSTGTSDTALIPGIYWLTVTNQYGCSATDTVNIRLRPLPVFSLGGDTSLCTGQVLRLMIPPVPGDNYLWSTGSTLSSLSIDTSGMYWLNVADTGCSKTDTIAVTFKPLPVINLGNDTVLCTGQTLALYADNSNATYMWRNGSTQPDYTVTGPGEYWVTVTVNGCSATRQIAVGYITKPVINIGSDTTICAGDQLVLNAAYQQATYLWQDGSTMPTYTVTTPGYYSVQATNVCGTITDSLTIQLKNCACKFYMPGAFTPNGDGRNDIFKPAYRCFFSKYQMRIFNRFGQNLYSSQNASAGWDGTFAGMQQPVGAYVWEIEYYDIIEGKMAKANGTLVLIR